MQTMNRKYFLRIEAAFFRNEAAQLIETHPQRYAIYVLYLKMILKAGRNRGRILFSGAYRTIEEQLASEFDDTKDMISTALTYLEKIGLVERQESRMLYFPGWQDMVRSECESAARMRRWRRKNKERNLVTPKPSQGYEKMNGASQSYRAPLHSDGIQGHTLHSDTEPRDIVTDVGGISKMPAATDVGLSKEMPGTDKHYDYADFEDDEE